jgi:hypothetical protein
MAPDDAGSIRLAVRKAVTMPAKSWSKEAIIRLSLAPADAARGDGRRAFMSSPLRRCVLLASVVVVAFALCGCATNPPPPVEAAAPPPAQEIPASIRPEEIVGRWGYGAYHNEADRPRTEVAARGQCGQPVVINRAPNGGVLMYLSDSAQLRELNLKGSPSGRNYVGPPGPAGGPQDREIVAFDGRTMVLRWMDPEVANRYGIGVYVRCAPAGVARSTRQPR